MKLLQNRVFAYLFYTIVFLNARIFQIGEHLNQRKSVISGHYSIFSSLMLILFLEEKVVHLL